MPWIWVAMPSDAARVACSASRAGAASQTPRPSLGAGGSPGGRSIGSRSAAVRDPSDPSAKALSQPRRSRSSGSGPSGSPLRIPAAARGVQLLRPDARVQAHAELARGGEPAVGVERPAEVVAHRQAARVVDGDDAGCDELAA